MISFISLVVSSIVAYGVIAGIQKVMDDRKGDDEKPATKKDVQDLAEQLKQDSGRKRKGKGK